MEYWEKLEILSLVDLFENFSIKNLRDFLDCAQLEEYSDE